MSKENIDVNFRPDSAFKFLFTHLSDKARIRILNSLFKIDIPFDTEIIISNTENTFSDERLLSVRADMIFDVGMKRKLHLEFQSYPDENIGIRMFLYGYLSAKEENNKVLCFPMPHILYTVLNKEKEGKEYILLDIPNCSVKNEYFEELKVRLEIGFTNLLSFSENDYKEKDLEALSFIYLYKYLKNKKKYFTEAGIYEIVENINEKVDEIFESIESTDRSIIKIPFLNLIKDIVNTAKNQIKNEEAVNMLAEIEKTYGEKIWEDGIEKGIEKGIESLPKFFPRMFFQFQLTSESFPYFYRLKFNYYFF